MDGLTEPDPVPSHGAMRTDQFLIQNGELVLIDLDGFCWANPARDMGNFLAYLCWKAIRQPEHGAFVETAGRAFLDAYLDARPNLDVRWLSLYQAASLLKIAGRRFRSLTFREWPLVIHLIDAANATLREQVEIGATGRGRGLARNAGGSPEHRDQHDQVPLHLCRQRVPCAVGCAQRRNDDR